MNRMLLWLMVATTVYLGGFVARPRVRLSLVLLGTVVMCMGVLAKTVPVEAHH